MFTHTLDYFKGKKLETKVFSVVKEQSFLTLKLLYFMFNVFYVYFD